jgi:hypothetical protein
MDVVLGIPFIRRMAVRFSCIVCLASTRLALRVRHSRIVSRSAAVVFESERIRAESEAQFGPFFLGTIPVEGWRVGQAYKSAILGAQPAAFTELIELSQFIRRLPGRAAPARAACAVTAAKNHSIRLT